MSAAWSDFSVSSRETASSFSSNNIHKIDVKGIWDGIADHLARFIIGVKVDVLPYSRVAMIRHSSDSIKNAQIFDVLHLFNEDPFDSDSEDEDKKDDSSDDTSLFDHLLPKRQSNQPFDDRWKADRCDDGLLYAQFDDIKPCTVVIELELHARLRAHPVGCHILELPGLPKYEGKYPGKFQMSIEHLCSKSVIPSYPAYSKVALVDEKTLQSYELQSESLEMTFDSSSDFIQAFLCHKKIQKLGPEHILGVYTDTREAYGKMIVYPTDITNTRPRESILLNANKVQTICQLRLEHFMFWSDQVEFTIYIKNGPTGIIDMTLKDGQRDVYIKNVTADHHKELKLTFRRNTSEVHKPFTLHWLNTFDSKRHVGIQTVSWTRSEFVVLDRNEVVYVVEEEIDELDEDQFEDAVEYQETVVDCQETVVKSRETVVENQESPIESQATVTEDATCTGMGWKENLAFGLALVASPIIGEMFKRWFA